MEKPLPRWKHEYRIRLRDKNEKYVEKNSDLGQHVWYIQAEDPGSALMRIFSYERDHGYYKHTMKYIRTEIPNSGTNAQAKALQNWFEISGKDLSGAWHLHQGFAEFKDGSQEAENLKELKKYDGLTNTDRQWLVSNRERAKSLDLKIAQQIVHEREAKKEQLKKEEEKKKLQPQPEILPELQPQPQPSKEDVEKVAQKVSHAHLENRTVWKDTKERRWFQGHMSDYKLEHPDANIFQQFGYALEKTLAGKTDITVPFFGKLPANPIEEALKFISNAIYTISSAFNVLIYISSKIPELLEEIRDMMEELEEYQKEIADQLKPMLKLVNDDLLPYIKESKEILGDDWATRDDYIPVITEPNTKEDFQKLQAMMFLMDAPFGLGSQYKSILKTAMLKHYQDQTGVGFANNWSMIDYALTSNGMSMMPDVKQEVDASLSAPPDWFIGDSASKQKRAAKAEHKESHKQLTEIRQKGGIG